MEYVTINQLVKRFSLDVLTGEEKLNRKITKSPSRRPGLEFNDYLDFLPHNRVHVFGENEVTYLHMLTEEQRDTKIGNIVKYNPRSEEHTSELQSRGHLV